MPAINIADLNNAKQDVDHLAAIATSTDLTATDRFGRTKRTLAALEAEYPNAQANADAAAINASVASLAKDLAQAAKAQAELARDSAMGAGNNFPTIADGIAATNGTTNKYFAVPQVGSTDLFVLYRNVGGTAVEQGRGPSTKILEQFAGYTGEGPIYPIATDQDNRIVLGFDASKNALVGKGLVTPDTLQPEIRTTLGGYSERAYIGAGPVWPFIVGIGNKVLLGFDEATQKLVGPGLGGADSAASALVDLPSKPITRAINHVLFYGESLSVGAAGTPVLSTTQPYGNLTFNGGPRAAAGDYSAFKPLVEDALPAPDGLNNRGETGCAAAANYCTTLRAIDGLSPSSCVIFSSTAGMGGARISQLTKGTSWYNSNFKAHFTNAHALNPDYAVQTVNWVQGANDSAVAVKTPYATYKAAFEQLQVDMEGDIKAISPLSGTVYLLYAQICFGVAAWPEIARAQLDVAGKNSKFFLVTPMYHFPHVADAVHLSNVGYKWMGAYFGRANKQIMDGKQPQFLKPVSATRRGAVIRVRFDVPKLPLVLDAVTLAATTDMGFVVKDGGSTAAISRIAVDGANVVITLASTPVGEVKVRYAMDYLGAGLIITDGASGNLRDSTPDVISISGVNCPLYHVAPHFEIAAIALGE